MVEFVQFYISISVFHRIYMFYFYNLWGIKQTFHDIIYRNMHISVLVEMAFTYQELAAFYLFLFTC